MSSSMLVIQVLFEQITSCCQVNRHVKGSYWKANHCLINCNIFFLNKSSSRWIWSSFKKLVAGHLNINRFSYWNFIPLKLVMTKNEYGKWNIGDWLYLIVDNEFVSPRVFWVKVALLMNVIQWSGRISLCYKEMEMTFTHLWIVLPA